MGIEQLYQQDVLRTTPAATLADVGRLMTEKDSGSVLVFDGEELVGIVTERDLVRAMVAAGDASSELVGAHMTPDPWVVPEDWELRAVAARMINHAIRHAPVVRDGRVVGVVSSLDLVAAIVLGAGDAATEAGR